MEQLKKVAKPVAGIALILYTFISLLRGVSGFLTILFALGTLVLGITCLIEKTEPIRIGAAALLAVVSLFWFINAMFDFLRMFFSGYPSFASFVFSVIGILGAALDLVAFAGLAALLFMLFKNMRNVLTNLWYAPAALALVSSILNIISSLFVRLIYSARITFSFLTGSFLQMVLAVILAVGLAALALGSQKE